MSANPRDRPSLCLFTLADGRRCRTPRTTGHPHFCFYHARKESQARVADKLANDLNFFLSGEYLSANDLCAALGRIIPAVVRGDIKPRTATTVAYLAQTLLQTIHLAQDEYINAFGTPEWRETIHNAVNQNWNYRHPAPPPAPAPASPPSSAGVSPASSLSGNAPPEPQSPNLASPADPASPQPIQPNASSHQDGDDEEFAVDASNKQDDPSEALQAGDGDQTNEEDEVNEEDVNEEEESEEDASEEEDDYARVPTLHSAKRQQSPTNPDSSQPRNSRR